MDEQTPLPPATADGEAALEAQLRLMRLLEENPALTQRQLSEALGLSLGKTHYLLHALLDKGLLKARNFRRSDRKMAYAYVLTPRGMRQKIKLTRDFLARKEAEFEALRQTIDRLRAEIDAQPSS
jgi:EPS-associated MarR family transcriptional regulator